MSFWDGVAWTDASAPNTVPRKPRLADRAATFVMIIGLIALMIPFSMAGAGRRYSGTLEATPDVLQAGESFSVSGCGYDTNLGNVVVGFTGGSWGSKLDSEGCFSIDGIPALSGDTLPPGVYEVRAFQKIKGRWRETGETTVTVVE